MASNSASQKNAKNISKKLKFNLKDSGIEHNETSNISNSSNPKSVVGSRGFAGFFNSFSLKSNTNLILLVSLISSVALVGSLAGLVWFKQNQFGNENFSKIAIVKGEKSTANTSENDSKNLAVSSTFSASDLSENKEPEDKSDLKTDKINPSLTETKVNAEAQKLSKPEINVETNNNPERAAEIVQKPEAQTQAKSPDTNYKILSPDDFTNLISQSPFQNTSSGSVDVSITSNIEADNYINKLAESRGYRLWPHAIEDSLETVSGEMKLQPAAKKDFVAMLDAAKNDGVIIGLTSGYRSPADQFTIFKSRFEAAQMAELGGYYSPEEILSGQADNLINRTLMMTAPPGYSRHHTGYTIDLSDRSPDNTTTVFNGSKAYKWMSDNNYYNARRFGFVPSYPKGGSGFGPEPEAWEFVWVGLEKSL